jgi:hypothetical protein
MSDWSGLSEGKARATPLAKSTAKPTEASNIHTLLLAKRFADEKAFVAMFFSFHPGRA